ncbi:preprotein translocase subunit SecA [Candidatus Vampirococcus lugosii]|uniref:Protein translocase subunit SecA n=1 Tax=Candidatus Vampirococcus lugosii TaxID=2789015 RepID=A0ABS5QLB6_9BACT|nr:Protein export cytoplasm protein SecA ATPase RNA helicase [Candidatus Vampirococcus lugosii]
MFNFLINKFVGDHHKKEINKILPIVDKINSIFESYNDLSDEELKLKTKEFKERYDEGENLDDILPEAFATVKQACKRLNGKEFEIEGEKKVWDMIPYDVQLLGGIILHKGNIGEMKTGEGKTLVATLPIYLNAISGKGAHLVTVNDYLAIRDAQWMGVLYNFLGLEVGSVTKGTAQEKRRQEYGKDITYVENSELGFDYLRDNLAGSLDQRALLRRPLNFAIIDEADSILIDEARTPLIISQPSAEATDKYLTYSKIVNNLIPSKGKKKKSKTFLQEIMTDDSNEEDNVEENDYYIDEKIKSIQLTGKGIQKLENIIGVENLYKDIGYDEIHHIENALKAKAVFQKDKDYIVKDNKVMLVDEHTGRIMPGRRLSEGLHQAIEAKEGVNIQRESKTVASITYQNFFKQYKKISGMTGTAITEAEEFGKIYELDSLPVPTNKPTIRVDKGDKVYFSQEAKWNAVMEAIKFYHNIGQPILIGTSSIITSETVSMKLRNSNINHYVLNAKYHEQEANIIKNAGKSNSVVVATNMAGRGTDIKLEDGLNEKLAINYSNWIKNNIDKNNISLNIFSNIELDLIINGINNVFSKNFENGISSNLKSELGNGINIEIIFNKSKKDKNDLLCNINFTKNSNTETLEEDLHFGLSIVATEKHESRRIDNQLRGRSGRQGDPGVSQFFVALDDEIMRKMGGDKIKTVAGMLLSKDELNSMELTQAQFTSSIERSQKQMEGWLFTGRKHLFDYDSVINKQRQRIYSKRDLILFARSNVEGNEQIIEDFGIDLEGFDINNEFKSFIIDVIDKIVDTYTANQTWNIGDMISNFEKIFHISLDKTDIKKYNKIIDFKNFLNIKITEFYDEKKSQLNEDIFQDITKSIYLRSIDNLRVEHIDEMQQLREKVGLFGYAQLDPLIMYKKEAFEKYQKLLFNVKQECISSFLKLDTEKIQSNFDFINGSNQEKSNKVVINKIEESDKNNNSEKLINTENNVENIDKKEKTIELVTQKNNKTNISNDTNNDDGIEVITYEDETNISNDTNNDDGIEVITYEPTQNNYGSENNKNSVIENNKSKYKAKPNQACPCGSGKKYKKCCGKH